MKHLGVLLLVLSFITASGQNRALDSLNALLIKTNNDTARINLMNLLIPVLRTVNLDSAVDLATATISIAKAKHYTRGEAEAHRQLGAGLIFKNKLAEAKEQLETALQLFHSASDPEGTAKVYGTYGVYYGVQSKYDSSTFYIKKQLDNQKYIRDKAVIGTAYQNIALNYFMQSDFLQALSYQHKAMDIADATHDEDTKAYIYLNMALVYDEMNDLPRMEQNLLKAVASAKKSGVVNVEQYAYANLASLYSRTDSLSQSYSYAMKAYELGKTTGDQGIAASSLSRAALVFAMQNRFTEAEQLNNKAIALADSAGAPLNKFQTLSTGASIKKRQKQYADAIVLYEKAFAKLADADIYNKEMISTYNDLSECYERTGNYRKAFASFKMATQISDSLKNRDNIRKATELSMQYGFDKKQQQQRAERAKEDRENTIKLLFLIGFLLVFITLSTVALFAYRREQKAKKLMNEQKNQIENTLNELKTTQAQLIQSEKMASLGELTAGIAHEIQNPLNFVNNFSELNSEMIEELKTELQNNNVEEALAIAGDIKTNEEKITHHGKRADAIVKGMLQHSRRNTGQKELTDINALCDEYLRLAYHGMRAKDNSFHANLSTHFDESIKKVNLVPQDIGRVLLNLFNNAFYAVRKQKGSSAGNYQPLVNVVTKKTSYGAEVIITDNGNGIPQNLIGKIFQPFFTTKPTGEGTGLGLSMSYDIITKEHNGTIRVESKEGEGTSFIITLPQ